MAAPRLTDTFPFVPEDFWDDVFRRGMAIYERLREPLERDHWNEYVTIHVDTGDYAVGKTSSQSTDALLQRHESDGRLFGRKIGSEPEYDMAARLFGPEANAQK